MNALCIFMLFVPIESIFNRYMIGIGNPLSLLFMIVCAKISISTRNEVCHWSNNALTEATEIGQTPLK
jgi:hypothetical protein